MEQVSIGIDQTAPMCICRSHLTKTTLCGSSVGRVFASAIDPPVRQFFSWKNNLPLPLIQEEQVVSHWRKNGGLILVNCLRQACPGIVWLSQ